MNNLLRGLALFCAALAVPASAQNLVVNGSFELPAIAGGSFQVVTSIPNWALTSGTGFEIQNNVAGSPFAGAQLIELDGFVNSGMQQVVPTTAGQAYVLSVEYSPRPGVAASSNGVDVLINGTLVTTMVADGSSLGNTSWSKYSFPFSATGPTTIEFRGAGTSDGLGGYIDDVQCVPATPVIPVPALSAPLLGALALMLAIVAWRMPRRVRRTVR